MAEQGETAAELKAKIAAYQEQLEGVEQLLLADPTNDQYQSLKDNLNQVISVTNDLVSESPHHFQSVPSAFPRCCSQLKLREAEESQTASTAASTAPPPPPPASSSCMRR